VTSTTLVNPPQHLDTDRLHLRLPRRDDAPAMFAAYAQDAEVTRCLTWRPHKSIEETYAILDLISKLWRDGEAFSYAITLKGNDSIIGMITLHPDGFKVSLGYVLARPHWSKGYMTEAVRAVADWRLRHLRCGQSRLGEGDGKGGDEIRRIVAEVYDPSQYQRGAEGLFDVCGGEIISPCCVLRVACCVLRVPCSVIASALCEAIPSTARRLLRRVSIRPKNTGYSTLLAMTDNKKEFKC